MGGSRSSVASASVTSFSATLVRDRHDAIGDVLGATRARRRAHCQGYSQQEHPFHHPIACRPLPGRVGPCDARGIMTRASDIDWSAAAWRLELAVEALKRDGLVIDRDLVDAALAQCRRYAAEGEPLVEFLPPNDPLLDLACRHDLSLDWIIIGDPRRR
jgi:hypothetical protein